jgi:hypothetical protein
MSDNKKNASKRAKPRTSRVLSAQAPKKSPSRGKSSTQLPTVFRVSEYFAHRDTNKGLSGLSINTIYDVPLSRQWPRNIATSINRWGQTRLIVRNETSD